MARVSTFVCLLSILLSGGIFGFFYTWSFVVMRGLSDTRPEAAILAMQSMNAAVPSGSFALIFFGTPLVAVVAAITYFATNRPVSAACLAGGAVVYVIGTLVVTFMVNVPMNQALAAMDLNASPDLAAAWRDYASPWTAWNHVRTLSCGLTLLLSAAALHLS